MSENRATISENKINKILPEKDNNSYKSRFDKNEEKKNDKYINVQTPE